MSTGTLKLCLPRHFYGTLRLNKIKQYRQSVLIAVLTYLLDKFGHDLGLVDHLPGIGLENVGLKPIPAVRFDVDFQSAICRNEEQQELIHALRSTQTCEQ